MMIYSWQQYSGTFTNPAAISISFGYDPQGNRWKQAITESGTTETRTFLYDREDNLAEYTDELLTERKAMYIHGPGIDETLALVSPECEVYVFLHDGLVGSVTGLVDQRGGFVNDYDYAAFGQWSVSSGRETIENRFMYTNREHVESGPSDTELYYYRARYYRPDLGRFISMDPLGMVDGTNQFGYVQNNPVMYWDSFGTDIYPPGRDPNNWPPSPSVHRGRGDPRYNCYAVCLGASTNQGASDMNSALGNFKKVPCYGPCGCEDGVIAIYYSDRQKGDPIQNPYGFCHCAICNSNQWTHKLGNGPEVNTGTAEGMADFYTKHGWPITKIGCFKKK